LREKVEDEKRKMVQINFEKLRTDLWMSFLEIFKI